MGLVLLHHDALRRRDAVGLQEAVEVGQPGSLHGAGHHQQAAAAGHIGRQRVPLRLGDVALGRVDDEAGGVLRDLGSIQEGEVLHGDVLLLQTVGEGGRQILLPVAGESIDHRLVGVCHIVDGGGDGPLAVKAGGVAVGVHGRVGEIDVLIADIAAAVAALHHQGVVVNGAVRVLLGEGGVHVRIPLLHGDMVREALVPVQELADHVVLLVGLDDPVDGDILRQGVHHAFGVAGDGVELAGADVVLRGAGGHGGDEHVHRDQYGQHHGGHSGGIGAAPHGVFLHQLYLLFSRDCTERNRKKAITLR